jgi:hypothetical protein
MIRMRAGAQAVLPKRDVRDGINACVWPFGHLTFLRSLCGVE